jgi:ribonuclease D
VNYTIITQQDELEHVCQRARQAEVVMLDTEFVRIRTFYPQLGLIQLYDGQALSLIDPTAFEDMTPFAQLLSDTSVLKVLHACGEDLEVFQNAFGCVPTPMVDTQIMAAFTGYGLSTGFAALVNELLNIDIDKSESRTDWLARPLTQRQLEYAAADVFYLLPIYTELQQRVELAGWWPAALEESALQASKRIKDYDPEYAYVDIKGSWQLTPKQLAILKPLATWRYNEAVRRDLALNFVIKESDLMLIAEHGLLTANQMLDKQIDPRTVQRHSAKLTQLVKQGLETAEHDYPEAIVPLMNYPTYKQLFKVLKDVVKGCSESSGLAPEFLASKKQLNQLISWVWIKQRNPSQRPDLMQGWRLELLGTQLDKLI